MSEQMIQKHCAERERLYDLVSDWLYSTWIMAATSEWQLFTNADTNYELFGIRKTKKQLLRNLRSGTLRTSDCLRMQTFFTGDTIVKIK